MNGKNISFPIYHIGEDSHEEESFHGLVVHKSTEEHIVMSLSDKLTGDVYYKDNSLAEVTDAYVYVEGIKYVQVSPPTILREGLASDNSELKGMTKYSFVFYHPMYMLGNFIFTDIAVTSGEEKYLSQNKTFSWIGTLPDMIAKLNANLKETEWLVGGLLTSEVDAPKANKISQVLTFDKNYINEVLKKSYEEWGIPFTIQPCDEMVQGVQKNFFIEFGTPEQEIYGSNGQPYIFRFGQGVGLKNNSRTPKNNKIITRIIGQGSERNIPYGYPQIPWYGDPTWKYTEYVNDDPTMMPKPTAYPIYKGIYDGQLVQLIKHPFTRKNLMPSIYVQDVFNKVSPYNIDGTPNTYYDPTIEIRDYHDADSNYVNPIDTTAPSVEMHTFEDIKPEFDSENEESIVSATPISADSTSGKVEEIPTITNFLNVLTAAKNASLDENEKAAIQGLIDFLTLVNEEEITIHYFDGKTEGAYVYNCVVQRKGSLYPNIWVVDYTSDGYSVHQEVTKYATLPAWDDTYDAEKDEYVQSYFRLKLPQLDFDLYACASITENMQINMRSGACQGCTFDVMVDWDAYKRNFYNENGEFDPVPHTTEGDGHVRNILEFPKSDDGQIEIICKKDINTFGTIMPNTYQRLQGTTPSAQGDVFVILGISLPHTYVRHAQERLDDAMDEYMLENNVHYYEYPLKFDEFFLANNVSILNQIKLNSIVRFAYPTQPDAMALFVKSITIKYGDKPLPEYDITLTDDIEIVLNAIGQVTDDVSRMRVQLSEIQKFYSQNIIDMINEKLSKVADDIAQGRITFQKGIDVLASAVFYDEVKSPSFVSDLFQGHGWRIDQLGNAEMESLRVRSFLEVVELLINRMQAQEGDTVFSDNDQIERVDVVTINGETSYILSLKQKYDGYVTSQCYGNILKGIINTLAANYANVSDVTAEQSVEVDGKNKYYTSWMRVVETPSMPPEERLVDLNTNQIRVALYGDNAVPARKNFVPCELMNIVRWGNTENPNQAGISAEEKKRRERNQSVFSISTTDGRITKYIGVNSPTLADTNIGTTLGRLPDFILNNPNSSIRKRLIEGRDYLYAQGVVVGDFIKIDVEGNPVPTYVDCGDWYDGGAQGANPTIGHGIYLCNETNPTTLQVETHEVWHNAEKWRCTMHQPVTHEGQTTYYEPTEGSQYWEKVVKAVNGITYTVEWTNEAMASNKVINSIACYSNGLAKTRNSGSSPWLKATLYRSEGGAVKEAYLASHAIIRAFLADGTSTIVAENQNPTTNVGATAIESTTATHIRYVVEFLDSDDEIIATSSIDKVFDGEKGLDGESAPSYNEEYYAWSNAPSTANVGAEPSPNSGWDTNIAAQGGWTYLWKKVVPYAWNSTTRQYDAGLTQYFRMSGTNGTSLSSKGSVFVVVDYMDSTLPLNAHEGETCLLENSRNIWKVVEGAWEDTQITCPTDGYNIVKSSDDLIFWDTFMGEWQWTSGVPHIVDGNAYTEQQEGHLWMWSAEASYWLDLGQFVGEAGKTYYTHVAWAENVVFSQSTLPIPEGQTNRPNATSVTNPTIVPNANLSQPFMGYLINEELNETINATLAVQKWTWQYAKGQDGKDAEVFRIEFQNVNGIPITSIPCDSQGKGKEVAQNPNYPWITAKIYRKQGSNYEALYQAGTAEIRCYLQNGTQVTTGGFPIQVGSATSDIVIPTSESTQNTHFQYKAKFFDNRGIAVAEASIYRLFDGKVGKVGRAYYYAGVFNSGDNTQQFDVNNAQTPFFEHIDSGNQKRYHVFYPDEVPDGGKMTMAQMWVASGQDWNNEPWQAMNNDFKYLIAEAIFAKFAKFGSAVINGDWLMSSYGTIYDATGQAFVIDDEHSVTIGDTEYTYINAYRLFDPRSPNASADNEANFVPTYGLDMLTGVTYQNDAHIRGEVHATSGTFSGYIKTLLTSIENSDAQVIIDSINNNRYYKLRTNLNLYGGFLNERYYIMLPNDASYIGAEVNIYAYPQMTRVYTGIGILTEGNFPILGYNLLRSEDAASYKLPSKIYWDGGIMTLLCIPPMQLYPTQPQCMWCIKSLTYRFTTYELEE